MYIYIINNYKYIHIRPRAGSHIPKPVPVFLSQEKSKRNPDQSGFSPSKLGQGRTGTHRFSFYCHTYQQA